MPAANSIPVKNAQAVVEGDAQLLLFTAKNCPNCKTAKAFLNDAGIKYVQIDAEENVDLCDKYGVEFAPTLVAVGKNEVQKMTNASEIRKFVENR